MCDERERLIGYVYGECDASEQREIEAHVASCPTCRQEIGGLRRVREDLLAWRVPEHEAVWRPLPQKPAAPLWSQMPGWAMAAAAGIVLMVGAAGGVLTHAAVASSGATTAARGSSPAATPVTLTAAESEAIVQRVLATMRNEMDQRERRVLTQMASRTSSGAGQVATEDLRKQIRDEILTDVRDDHDALIASSQEGLIALHNEVFGIQQNYKQLESKYQLVALQVGK